MSQTMNGPAHPPHTSVEVPDICLPGVVELSRLIREREVSCVEVMTAYLDHIERANPPVNAIVSQRPRSDLLAEARRSDEAAHAGARLGPLYGVPQAIKDVAATKGLRTTYGSPLFADNVPSEDAIFVERMRAAGAIIIGKTNVPEFGYGSNSYNPVFGLTRNAYDPTRIAGGSSGGAAVALALRMLPVADGSDMGGSLRNPAAFNNVFGFRPTQGAIPSSSADAFYGQLGIDGPMGRSVSDVALLFGIQAGFDQRAPLSLDLPHTPSSASSEGRGLRFGWLGDFNNHLAFEPGLLDLAEAACGIFIEAGATVEPASVGFEMETLWSAFKTLRQVGIVGQHDAAYKDPAKRKLLKPEAIWEIEQGYGLSALDVYNAGMVRADWYRAFVGLFERFDFLLLPTTQVFPFSGEITWPKEIAGRTMDSYHRWMEVVIGPTMAGCPAISVPAGFNERGLPVGLQVIGKPRQDHEVLRAAALYEKLCPWLERLPNILGVRS